MSGNDWAIDLISERLEMGTLLATAERVALSSDEARTVAEWLTADLAVAGVALVPMDVPR